MNLKDKHQDFRWIISYQRCNKEALNQLIKKYYGYIYKSFIYLGLPRMDAEDCTQEICLRLVTRLKNFKFKSSFTTFLYRAIRNRVIDFYAQHQQRLKLISLHIKLFIEDNELELIDLLETCQYDDPERNHNYKNLVQTVKKCIEQIKHQLQKKLVALWLDGHKRKNMAELLGIPLGTVHGELERGKSQLRNCVITNYCSSE